MRALVPLALVLLAAGCDRSPDPLPAGGAESSDPAGPTAAAERPSLAASDRHALAEGRCLACHEAGGDDPQGIAPLPSPSLAGIGDRVSADWLVEQLLGHRVGSEARAKDLTAYLVAATGGGGLEAASVGAGRIEQGAALFGELGCRACHDAEGVEGLSSKTDFGSLVEFLGGARGTRPDLGFHDFRLEGNERSALAAWLLRETLRDASEAPPTPGLHWECYEQRIPSSGRPTLEGAEPSGSGTTDAFDANLATRESNVALRFHGGIEVADAGTYKFVTGSDDASFLSIDGKEIVTNEGMHPHRRREGSVELTAGLHEFELLFTQGGGGKSLEVLWQPPGASKPVPLPADVLSARSSSLVPPTGRFTSDADAVSRGEKAFAAARCAACHDAPGLAEAAPARPWADLQFDADCTVVPGGASVLAARRALALANDEGPSPDQRLAFAWKRDRCAACHGREGEGGMRSEAVEVLVELEDLGDEGRLPPDLSGIGHRLRPEWTAAFLRGAESARPYVRARCVALESEDAESYAALLDALDAVEGDADDEPSVDGDVIAEGKRIVGSNGFACIACHQVAGRPSLGPQGMDLTMQGRRLKPAWMREWLGSPATLRPGTRMPTFWPDPNADAAKAQIAAVQAWSALGGAAPLPAGLAPAGGATVLQVGERPRLHGAFLKDLSAKTLAVGTPERTHYAWDLRNARFAWLWRGEFMDSAGTWNGRAGKLIVPLDQQDWVLLPDGPSFVSAADREQGAKAIARRMDADGYPAIRYSCGDASIDDYPRPRYGRGGTELVRRVAVTGADVVMTMPAGDDRLTATVDGERVTDELTIPAGQTVEVIYSW